MTNKELFKKYLDEVAAAKKLKEEEAFNKLKETIKTQELIFRQMFGNEININPVVKNEIIRFEIVDTNFYLVLYGEDWVLFYNNENGVSNKNWGSVSYLGQLLNHVANYQASLEKLK